MDTPFHHPWLRSLRENARTAFQELPLPQEREEAWRYTDLKRLNVPLQANTESSVSIECDTDKIIAADFATALRQWPDLIRQYIGKLVQPSDKLAAFHYANLSDGIFVHVPRDAVATVSVAFENPNAQTIIVAETGSRLHFNEILQGDGTGLSTDATEIFAAEGSSVSFNSFQNYGPLAFGTSFKQARVDRDARVAWTFFAAGGKFYRLQATSLLAGEGAEAETTAAFLARDKQHIDITTNARHLVPHTSNNILAKGALLDASTAVYRGMIHIAPGAQQTNSYLSDHMLMVGDEALAQSVPGLEINANDVKASHGSTKGQIDEELLFYLESRGIPRREAEKLVVQGFFGPVLQRIQQTAMRERIAEAIGLREE